MERVNGERELQDKIEKILDALRKVPAAPGEVKVIAIDGRCASGKTTLAEKLLTEGFPEQVYPEQVHSEQAALEKAVMGRTGVGIVHMDDFFLPRELRTAERLSEAGGNVDYERFAIEVLPYLKKAEEFSYRRFDCSRMELGEACVIPAGSIRIVEGAYSCHPKFGDYMTLRVFCDILPEEQRTRIRKRNGEKMLERFVNEWIPMEETYLKEFRIRERADVIIRS